MSLSQYQPTKSAFLRSIQRRRIQGPVLKDPNFQVDCKAYKNRLNGAIHRTKWSKKRKDAIYGCTAVPLSSTCMFESLLWQIIG